MQRKGENLKYIDVEVAVDELATTGPEMRNLATYGAIKQYCLDNYDMKMTTLYITQVKHKCGLPICIFLVVYGRMIEIYLVTSVGPIPLATMGNREWSLLFEFMEKRTASPLFL